jgi:WD40 repeat protein
MPFRVNRFVGSLVGGLILSIWAAGAEDGPPKGVRRFGTTRFRHEGLLTEAAFPADGKFLATVGTDRCLRLWDLASGKLLRQHCPLPDRPGTLALYDVATGKRALRVPFVGSAPVVAFSADGRALAVAGADTTILLYDLTRLAK